MTEHNCPVESCSYSTDSNRGLSIHASSKHPNLEHDFTNKTEFTCPYCKDTFKDYKSRRSSKNENKNFCSRECKDSFEGRNGLDTTCTECGNNTHISPSQINEVDGYEQKNYFCSKECESVFKKREWKGEEHPSYDGGTIKHMGKNWRSKRQKVLNRDNNTCQHCGISMKEHKEKYKTGLHVHHKVPRSQILSDEPTKSEFELANSTTNLITLCVSCHRKAEHN